MCAQRSDSKPGCASGCFIDYEIRIEEYVSGGIPVVCGVSSLWVAVLGSENAFARGTLGFRIDYSGRKCPCDKDFSDFSHLGKMFHGAAGLGVH